MYWCTVYSRAVYVSPCLFYLVLLRLYTLSAILLLYLRSYVCTLYLVLFCLAHASSLCDLYLHIKFCLHYRPPTEAGRQPDVIKSVAHFKLILSWVFSSWTSTGCVLLLEPSPPGVLAHIFSLRAGTKSPMPSALSSLLLLHHYYHWYYHIHFFSQYASCVEVGSNRTCPPVCTTKPRPTFHTLCIHHRRHISTN